MDYYTTLNINKAIAFFDENLYNIEFQKLPSCSVRTREIDGQVYCFGKDYDDFVFYVKDKIPECHKVVPFMILFSKNNIMNDIYAYFKSLETDEFNNYKYTIGLGNPEFCFGLKDSKLILTLKQEQLVKQYLVKRRFTKKDK